MKRFSAPWRIRGLLAALVGLGVVVGIAFSFKTLFASRSQLPGVANQPASDVSSPTTGPQPSPPVTRSPSFPSSSPAIGKTNPTAGWETFEYRQNPSYKYSIRYPPGWTVSTTPDSLVDFGAAYFQSPGKSVIYTTVTKAESESWQLEDMIENTESYLGNFERSTLKVQGLRAQSVSGVVNKKANPFYIGFHEQTVFIKQDNKVYRISMTQAPDENISSIFRTMLSTFASSIR